MEHFTDTTKQQPTTRQEKLAKWRQEKKRLPAGTSSSSSSSANITTSSPSRRTSFSRTGSVAAMTFINSLRRTSLGNTQKVLTNGTANNATNQAPSANKGRRMSSWGRSNTQKENSTNNATATRHGSASFKVRSTRTNSADAATAAAAAAASTTNNASARHQSFKLRRRSERDVLGNCSDMLPPRPRAPHAQATTTDVAAAASTVSSTATVATITTSQSTQTVPVPAKESNEVSESASQVVEEQPIRASVGTATDTIPQGVSVAIQTNEDATTVDDTAAAAVAMALEQLKQEMADVLKNNDSLAQMAIELEDKLQACEQQVGELRFSNEVLLQQQREMAVKAAKERRENHGLRHLQSRMHDQKLGEQSDAFTKQVSVLNNSLKAGLQGAVSKIQQQQAQLDRQSKENKALRRQLSLAARDHHREFENNNQYGEEDDDEEEEDVEDIEDDEVEADRVSANNSSGHNCPAADEGKNSSATEMVLPSPLAIPTSPISSSPSSHHQQWQHQQQPQNRPMHSLPNLDDEEAGCVGGMLGVVNEEAEIAQQMQIKRQDKNKMKKNNKRQSVLPTSLSEFVLVDDEDEQHGEELHDHQKHHQEAEGDGLFKRGDEHRHMDQMHRNQQLERRTISDSVSSMSSTSSCDSDARGGSF